MHSLFFELGLVVISAALIGTVGYYLKQPLVLAYIAAGVLIGPFGFGLVESVEIIEIIAKVGIMLMLFLVGLEMNPKRLRHLGKVSFFSGIGQILFTGFFGYLLVRMFGFESLEAFYLMIALTFSSTVIAVKLIYDKRDNNSLYGQVTIGILLIQDLIAVVALFILAGFAQEGVDLGAQELILILLKGVAMVAVALLVASRALGYLYNKIATSNELLILTSLAWAFLVALIAEAIGFGVELGAFIAGISLASLPYTFEINAKAKVLRDFFITIFFVGLGAGMIFTSLGPLIPAFILLSLFVLIGNPLIVMLIMNLLGYDKRSSFFTGLAVANISEFSLILVAQGQGLGLVSPETTSMVTMIGVLTMTVSSYFMTYNNFIYTKLKKVISLFWLHHKKERLSSKPTGMKNHLILLGCGHMGHQILHQIKGFKEDYLVVDHDNTVIQELIAKKEPCVFGDIEDEELLQELDLEGSEMVISTLPGAEDNLFLLRQVSHLPHETKPIIIVTADTAREGMELFNKGADYVILKPYLGASHIHQINKELYGLGEESSLADLEEVASEKKSHFKNDQDYAKLLHNLNKLRLKEIQAKLKSRSKKKGDGMNEK